MWVPQGGGKKKRETEKKLTWVTIKEQDFQDRQMKGIRWKKSDRMNSEKESISKRSQLSEKHVKRGDMETVALGTGKLLC